MSSSHETRKIHSLYRLSKSIQTAIETNYSKAYWIKAEMSKLGFSGHSGHCYPSLVEKFDGKIIAEMRGVIWRNDFEKIHRNFIQVLKEPLKDGIQILFHAFVTYDPKYGIGLRIIDIDPAYILGELEREKRESIERLQNERIFDQNKKIPAPLLPKRMAVISQKTSDGYSDFLNVLNNNSFGYTFSVSLIPAALQGDKAVSDISTQLHRIENFQKYFDVVVIIRGGGGDVGMSCYNNYQLAKKICLFPLPVYTGIGHSTNLTVSEMVSHATAITPTKLAEDFIQRFHDFAIPVENGVRVIKEVTKALLLESKRNLTQTGRALKNATKQLTVSHIHQIANLAGETARAGKYRLREEKQISLAFAQSLRSNTLRKLSGAKVDHVEILESIQKATPAIFDRARERFDSCEKLTILIDPMNTVRRGYSITRVNGKVVKEISGVKINDDIETIVSDGVLLSKILKTKNTKNG